ncbi:MAG TPA: sugar ABC transporter permease [Microbacterium sp.]|uniref:carbohydrate ABC transporter permease n=1 Tax=Microbacterium sp. TaxID=51671 RepID=UPI002B49F6F4|nr:sugar ABC transporter permease [Microbacterium sp.]HKT56483.1 sugar ABC transporter permease [Microbacterium sp.]
MSATTESIVTGARRGSPGPRAYGRRRPRSDFRVALLFIAPALIGLVVFYIVPTIRGVYLSFTDYSILGEPTWVGGKNYAALVKDPLFWNSLAVTAEYVIINIVVQTVIAVGLGLLMNHIAKSTLVRGMLLMPYLVANVIAAMVWFWLLDYNLGIVNDIISSLGMPRIAFFGDSFWAIPTQAIINTWRNMGYTSLLIFAGLQAIPDTVYEAARIDGAGPVTTFRKITLPLLRPVLALVLVLTVTGSFQIFDTVAVTTQGGPVNATRVIQYYIYQVAFGQQEFGYGSAIAVVLFVILGVIAFAQMKLLRGNQSDLG